MKKFKELIAEIKNFDPHRYAQTRNFLDGGVSKLSPYISRGIISTKQVFSILNEKGYKKYQLEKFVQELAWRDYWQKKWQSIIDIDIDLKNNQSPLFSSQIPSSITNASTSISAIDKGINDLYDTGYMHNHLRMYTASICCNIGNYHWLNNAKWMYYHLLDGDWGSNALSWQWVAGTNSHKKYYANQTNINKYCFTSDKNTFLDFTYEELIANNKTPEVLENETNFKLKTPLPKNKTLKINSDLPTLIYTSYNLDPNWFINTKANRILLFEPSQFELYPVSNKVIEFIIKLSREIEDIQIAVMDFDELYKLIHQTEIFFKEHPFSNNYLGNKTERDWLFPEIEAKGSFFNYWKKGMKKHQLL